MAKSNLKVATKFAVGQEVLFTNSAAEEELPASMRRKIEPVRVTIVEVGEPDDEFTCYTIKYPDGFLNLAHECDLRAA